MSVVNPVLGREVTERLRGLRAFVAVTAFVLVLTLTAWLVYQAVNTDNAFDLAARTRAGRTVFETVILIMLVLVLFFVPGLTAGAIAGERERQTLATLQVTLLRPRSIVAGKVLAALAFLGLLLVAALPVLAVAYVLGGIRLLDVGKGLLAVAVIALLVAAMVVAVSSMTRRVQTATLLSYAFVALLSITGPGLYGIATLLDARDQTPDAQGRVDQTVAPAVLLTWTPIALVADVAGGERGESGPLSAVREGLGEAWERNRTSWTALFPDGGEDPDVFGADDREHPQPRAWLLSLAAMTVVAGLMSWGATRRLRTPAEVER